MNKTQPVFRHEGTRRLGPMVLHAEICHADPVGLAIAPGGQS
jgi:hypothetical protein